ncbi:MAG TPA: phosphopantothenoylcysteine decarboxylase, partial [Phycisphaerales bacterium]|nr:phosphopantothenoylcysteine decarboxylase [Phycisphaerales bacterium]
ITAGPTHEAIDTVRYLANRSSGRMGISLAEAAAKRGCATTLLLGPTHLEPPKSSRVTTLRFRTTADLQQLLTQLWPAHDLLIMAAAVADYRPIREPNPQDEKLQRTHEPLTLHLEPTPDLLAELAGETRSDQNVVGFALEPPSRLMESARRKLARKSLDAIVANPLETMDAETVSATLILRDETVIPAPVGTEKGEFADWLMDQLAAQRMLAS